MWFLLHHTKICCERILLSKCNFWYYKIFNIKKKSMELSCLGLCAPVLNSYQIYKASVMLLWTKYKRALLHSAEHVTNRKWEAASATKAHGGKWRHSFPMILYKWSLEFSIQLCHWHSQTIQSLSQKVLQTMQCTHGWRGEPCCAVCHGRDSPLTQTLSAIAAQEVWVSCPTQKVRTTPSTTAFLGFGLVLGGFV